MRSGFIETCVDLRVRDDETAVVLSDLIFYDAHSRRHVAPRGFVTDGGSIPRFFWRIVGAPIRTPYLRAYVIHDHYCAKAQSISPGDERDALRLAADRQLRDETLPACGASRTVCRYHYRAVRLGARHTRNDPAAPYPVGAVDDSC